MKNSRLIAPLLVALTAVPVLAAPTSAPPKSASLLALAGYEPLGGEGLIVTLNDRAKTTQKSSDPTLALVHDFDVLRLVNELRFAGAQGISVGGIRLTNQSSIRCVGPRLLVDNKNVAIPVRVEAVGNAALLKARLEARGGVRDTYESGGPLIQVSTASKLQLKAASLPGQTPTTPALKSR